MPRVGCLAKVYRRLDFDIIGERFSFSSFILQATESCEERDSLGRGHAE
jgi:hypothetical protein